MPLQDDIDAANLGRLEREARRQKRAAQQAPVVQYMGTDGATGQVRVISGSGAASERVANHSNTQARPGDIKRGFAGGFDRGNVRKQPTIIRKKVEVEEGNVRVLYLKDSQLYVGGFIKEPLPTEIIIPSNAISFQYYIEDVGEGEGDHIVSYSYYVGSARTIGSYNGSTGERWQINNADVRFSYRRYGVFSTDLIRLSDTQIVPGTNNTTLSETVDVSSGGVIFPNYWGDSGSSGTTTRTFTGSGIYTSTIAAGITIATHSYYQQTKLSNCTIPYGSQSKTETYRDSTHRSSTLCLRASSASVEQVVGSQSYSDKINQMSGTSGSGGQPGDAWMWDSSFYGSIDNSTIISARLPVAIGRNLILEGERSEITSSFASPYSWQRLISIPAPYGYATGVASGYYQDPLPDFPPTTIVNQSNEISYVAGSNIRDGHYYTKEVKENNILLTLERFLSDGRKVSFQLYNQEIITIAGQEFRYAFSSEANFYPLITQNNLLTYQATNTLKAELKIISPDSEYIPLSVSVPFFSKLLIEPV
ncbi:MAG: hypothetical protein ACRC62_03625 [Microcoleus sp.]